MTLQLKCIFVQHYGGEFVKQYVFFFAFQWLTSTLIPYCVGFKIFWGNCCQESFSQLCRLALIQSWDGHKISLGYICRLKKYFSQGFLVSILTVSYCFHPLTIYAKAYWRIVIFTFTDIYTALLCFESSSMITLNF